ncbi:DoxX family protein [Pseudonocardia alaniniphila]|uniref:DoxX family protein n=1 Tax=Pseudonocardia alaniniphila TaxID=75291 RepID=UPI003380E855
MRLRLSKPIVADEMPTVEFEGPTQPIRRQAEQDDRPDPANTRATEPSRPAGEAGSTARHRGGRLLDVIGTLARLGLAVVWIVSGVTKLLDPGQTYLAVKAYDVLPTGMIGPVADALPLVELCLGMLLLAGIGVRFAAASSAVLLLVFAAAVGQAWMRGLTIECGCFGGGGEVAADDTRYGQDLLRDVAFLALAGWLVLRPRTWGCLGTITVRRTPTPEAETEPPPAARPTSAAGPTKPAPARPTATMPRPAPQTAAAPPAPPSDSAESASHEQLVQQIAQVKGVLAQTRRQLRAVERAHAAQTARADRAEAARDAALAHAAAVAQKPRTTRVAIINSGRVTGIEMRTGSREEEFSAAWPTR